MAFTSLLLHPVAHVVEGVMHGHLRPNVCEREQVGCVEHDPRVIRIIDEHDGAAIELQAWGLLMT